MLPPNDKGKMRVREPLKHEVVGLVVRCTPMELLKGVDTGGSGWDTSHGAAQNISNSSRKRESRATASDRDVFLRSNGRTSMRRSALFADRRCCFPEERVNCLFDSGIGKGTISVSESHSMRKRW